MLLNFKQVTEEIKEEIKKNTLETNENGNDMIEKSMKHSKSSSKRVWSDPSLIQETRKLQPDFNSFCFFIFDPNPFCFPKMTFLAFFFLYLTNIPHYVVLFYVILLFCLKIFFIGVQLIYNVMLLSPVHHSESILHTHISSLFQILFSYRSLQNIK